MGCGCLEVLESHRDSLSATPVLAEGAFSICGLGNCCFQSSHSVWRAGLLRRRPCLFWFLSSCLELKSPLSVLQGERSSWGSWAACWFPQFASAAIKLLLEVLLLYSSQHQQPRQKCFFEGTDWHFKHAMCPQPTRIV